MCPEQVLGYVKKRIKKEWRICFGSALAVGVFAHIYKLTNFIPNWDSLLNLHTDQNKTDLGRCFLKYACAPGSFYDLPWINGILSLIYIALSAVCVCELLEMRKKVPLMLTGALMAVFPTVTSTLAYNYTADGYFLALLCMCLAVILTVRCKRGIVPAAVLIAFGMGSYQAYVTFALVFMLIYLIDQLLFHKMSLKDFRNLGVRCAGSIILGIMGYWISLKIVLMVSGEGLSEYQNIGQAFSFQSIELFLAARESAVQFLLYFFDFSQGVNLFLVLNILLVIILAVLFLTAFKIQKIMQEPWRLAAVLLCMAALPFVSYAVYFISTTLDYHNLMVMCLSLFYILPLLFYERLDGLSKRAMAIKQWIILGLSVLTVCNFILLANISYLKMHMAYEKSYGVLVRLTDRIEQLPGAAECQKIAVLGWLEGSESVAVNFPPSMTGITDSYIIRRQDTMMRENVTQAMLRDYCGLFYEDTTEDEVERIRHTEAVKEMGCWPAQSSVAVIGDILVVKFGEEFYEQGK